MHHLHTVLSFTSDDKVFMADFGALPAKLPISNQEGRKPVVSIISCSCHTDGRDDLRERFYIEVVQQWKEHMATFSAKAKQKEKVHEKVLHPSSELSNNFYWPRMPHGKHTKQKK